MSAAEDRAVSLAGTWRFALDRANVGVSERWFARSLAEQVQLPGTLAAQGIGDEVSVATAWTGDVLDRSYYTSADYAPYRQPGNVKIPFFLQPDRHYVGAAWYQREIEIPAAWMRQRVVLTLERPHWQTTVWIDDRIMGSNDSLSTPHVYDLGSDLAPGSHRLTIRVDNTIAIEVGVNAHSVSDHTQGNWNGIVGALTLATTARARFDDVQVYPRVATRSVEIRGSVAGVVELASHERVVRLEVGANRVIAQVAADGSFVAELSLGADAALWDEFTPVTHQLRVELGNGESRTIAFGVREFSVDGRELRVNGRPLFLRGALECAIHPLTGHPPTEIEPWRKIMRAVKAHGLNHLRFHSWCPPEAAFAAADETGVYLQVECGTWPNALVVQGPGSPRGLGDGAAIDQWVFAEAERIIRAYGNHPSFVMLAAGNEPGGPNHATFLARWLDAMRARDSRRLYTGTAGWPEIPENQFHVISDPRIQHWGEGLQSRINALPPETRTDYREIISARGAPVVSHEIGQWCVFPNLAEIPKYTGYLKPRNFEIFRDSLAAHGLAAQANEFLIASGKLQALCYKEDIEAALRTPQMGGFQLLNLQDFSGQGTALVGVLDAFWEPKGYISAEEFRRFSNSTVPLARLPKRVFTADETLEFDLEVAHFGASPLRQVTRHVRLVGPDGRVHAEQTATTDTLPIGHGAMPGQGRISLRSLPAPARYKLVVTVDGFADGPATGSEQSAAINVENDWDIWVYPTSDDVAIARPGIKVVRELDADALAALEAGGAVLLSIPSGRVAPDRQRGPIALGFSSIFWNTAWTGGQAPHTLGVLCDPRHPALAQFPTESHSNWQWWYPITHAGAMILDDLPRELHPIVQVIDDWFTNRRLALVFEARVGGGRLLVSSIDFAGDLDPVRRQLLASLLAYAGTDAFNPNVEITVEQVRALISAP